MFLGARGAVGSFSRPPLPRGRFGGAACRVTRSRSVLFKGHGNDPSAGSPTSGFWGWKPSSSSAEEASSSYAREGELLLPS